jgi:hypothetical protein
VLLAAEDLAGLTGYLQARLEKAQQRRPATAEDELGRHRQAAAKPSPSRACVRETVSDANAKVEIPRTRYHTAVDTRQV